MPTTPGSNCGMLCSSFPAALIALTFFSLGFVKSSCEFSQKALDLTTHPGARLLGCLSPHQGRSSLRGSGPFHALSTGPNALSPYHLTPSCPAHNTPRNRHSLWVPLAALDRSEAKLPRIHNRRTSENTSSS